METAEFLGSRVNRLPTGPVFHRYQVCAATLDVLDFLKKLFMAAGALVLGVDLLFSLH